MTNEQAMLAVGWIRQRAVDRDGKKLGQIADVYVDVGTGAPTWTVIRGGSWRRHARFAPFDGVAAEGSTLRFPFSRKQLQAVPKVPIDGRLESDEADELRHYYRFVSLEQMAPAWQRVGEAPSTGQPTEAVAPAGAPGAPAAPPPGPVTADRQPDQQEQPYPIAEQPAGRPATVGAPATHDNQSPVVTGSSAFPAGPAAEGKPNGQDDVTDLRAGENRDDGGGRSPLRAFKGPRHAHNSEKEESR